MQGVIERIKSRLSQEPKIDLTVNLPFLEEINKHSNLENTFNQVHDEDNIDQMCYLLKAQEIQFMKIYKENGGGQNGNKTYHEMYKERTTRKS